MITLEEIYAPVEAPLQAIPHTILDILSTPNELAQDVVRYFFSGKGKLLRPALTLLGAKLSNQDTMPPVENERRLRHLAASFEIFHGATLIHDDIIDSAYLRRNLPTVNIKWGPEVAVLVGDYLHDKAIGSIFKNGHEKIITLFLEMAGTVCDGEIHELKEKGNLGLTEAEYIQIVDKKTAALLACCIESGFLFAEPLAGGSRESLALKQFGHWFGIAFQIVDDCLDFTGQENEFGKTLGADCAAGVLTLPLIRLLAVADKEKKREIVQILESHPQTGKFQILLEMIREYETIEYSLQKAREYSDKARSELALFHDSQAKRSLDRLLDYVLERNK